MSAATMRAHEDRAATRSAVALSYELGGVDAAPRIVASGRGALAERIAETARRYGVPVREDAELAALLAACDVGVEIPPELYAAVAEVLTWVLRREAEFDSARESSLFHEPPSAPRGPTAPD